MGLMGCVSLMLMLIVFPMTHRIHIAGSIWVRVEIIARWLVRGRALHEPKVSMQAL